MIPLHDGDLTRSLGYVPFRVRSGGLRLSSYSACLLIGAVYTNMLCVVVICFTELLICVYKSNKFINSRMTLRKFHVSFAGGE